MNNIRKRLNSFETLKENLENYINIFTDYYGEEKRQEIEKKFKNIRIYTTIKEEDYINYTNYLLDLKSNELKETLFKKLNNILKKEDLFNTYSYKDYQLFPIEKYIKFINLITESKELRKQYFINEGYEKIKKELNISKQEYKNLLNNKENKNLTTIQSKIIEYYKNDNNINIYITNLYKEIEPLLQKISPNITINKITIESKAIQALNKIGEIYKSHLEEYQNYVLELKSYTKYYEYLIKQKKELETKYYKDYIKENIKYLNNYEEIQDYLQSNKDIKIKELEILGLNLFSRCLIENFSYESNEKIKENSLLSKIIKKNRIKYLNILNIKIKDYDEIINNEKIIKLFPNPSDVDKILKSRKKYQEKYKKEYIESRNDYKYFRQQEQKLNLINKENILDYNLIINNIPSCIIPNIIKENDEYILSPILLINLSYKHIDEIIIHELNHIYEMNIIEANDYGYKIKNGFEEINKENISDEYKYLNELINQAISNEIIDLMYKNNKNILSEKEEKTINKNYYLIKKFYETNKKEIIESRQNKMEILYNRISKIKLDELNNKIQEKGIN